MSRGSRIIITRTGFDPCDGNRLNDPYLGATPTFGGCRPDIRSQVMIGDKLFFVSGKVRNFDQMIYAAFEVSEKIHASDAYKRFPDLRLKTLDGQRDGNILVDAYGKQHPLDDHKSFENRLQHYIVGKDLRVLETPEEFARGREQTLPMLQELFESNGKTPKDILGRGGRKLTDEQATKLFLWLESLKTEKPLVRRAAFGQKESSLGSIRQIQPVR